MDLTKLVLQTSLHQARTFRAHFAQQIDLSTGLGFVRLSLRKGCYLLGVVGPSSSTLGVAGRKQSLERWIEFGQS